MTATFTLHTTRHPRLTIAAVLALGMCADWIADGAANLILRVIA
jgi:hypothetical protein